MTRIEVDVHGDVAHPGVYQLPFDARVQDAVAAAGGYLHHADAADVDAAAPLNDGQEVVIASISGPASALSSTVRAATAGEPGSAAGTGAGETVRRKQASAGLAVHGIDLNTATAATLETLPDIGPGRAGAIIAWRSAHGPFPTLDTLQQVRGIGPTIWGRIVPYLYVSDGGKH